MIVLDTHILLWWAGSPEKLSPKAQEVIKKEASEGLILVSSISVWEIYLLIKKGRLKLTLDTDSWMERIEKLPFVQFVPIDNRIAAKSVDLPGKFHDDPADRIIVATAREKGVTLVTSDVRIRKYSHVRTVW